MENYLNKNIYKVSNPPGGASSIQLGWDSTVGQDKHSKQFMNSNKSMIYEKKPRMDEDYMTIQGSRSMVYEIQNSPLQNISYVENSKKYLNKNEEYY
jgi:hypothetical protein